MQKSPVIRLVATPSKWASDEVYAVLSDLDEDIFPYDDPYPLDGAYWWIAYHEGEAIAFAGLKLLTGVDKGRGFLCRAGVLPEYRGAGLQRRLIGVRDRMARRLGLKGTLTYVSGRNQASVTNLSRCGYLPYLPSTLWAGSDMIYFYKNFGPTSQGRDRRRKKVSA